jgi:hypothetical protein
MRRRGTAFKHASALALILAPAAGGIVVACGDDTVQLVPEGGAEDATLEASLEASIDASQEAASTEASCAVFDAGPLDPNQVAAGLQLVGTHKCENCHGSTLSGNPDGVPSKTAEGGTAYPPNLTPDPATGLGCWTNAQIENAILNGIDNQGMLLCAPMPVFGQLPGDAGLTLAEAQLVVDYLRSLTPTSMNVPDTPSCPVPVPVDAGNDGPVDLDAAESGTTADAESGTDASSEAEASADAADANEAPDATDANAPTDASEAGNDGGSLDDSSSD